VNYFLDLGTHYFVNGECDNGLLGFEKELFFGVEPPYEWHVVTFEPSEDAWKCNLEHQEDIAKRFASFEMKQAAIADRGGTVTFKWLPHWKAASTCVAEPLTEIEGHYAIEYEVEAIDIRQVIDNIIANDRNAFIVVKCDIEGAEFSVLPRLLTIAKVGVWVKAIYVEWHDRFWRNKPQHNEIIQCRAMIEQKCQDEKIKLCSWG
jgi:FkbM family methyltransferase